jgi:hypothetical protein
LVSLFVAVHPVHAATVCWISARGYLLTAAFTFAALSGYILYARSRDRGAHSPAGGRVRWLYYSGSLLCYILGLLSYCSMLGLPVVLLCYEWFVLGEGRPVAAQRLKRGLAALWPFVAVTAIYAVLIDRFFPMPPGALFIGAVYHAAAVYKIIGIMFAYLSNLFSVSATLSGGEPLILPPLADVSFYATRAGLLLAFLAMAAALYRRHRWMALAPCIFFVYILPGCLYVYPHGQFVTRFLYLPSFGAGMILCGMFLLAKDVFRGRHLLAFLLAAATFTGMVYATGSTDDDILALRGQGTIDGSPEGFFRTERLIDRIDALTDPGRAIFLARAYDRLERQYARAMLTRGEFTTAVRAAREKNPLDPRPAFLLARVYAGAGAVVPATAALREASGLNRYQPSYDAAMAYAAVGDGKALEECCGDWHRRDPQNPCPLLMLAEYHAARGERHAAHAEAAAARSAYAAEIGEYAARFARLYNYLEDAREDRFLVVSYAQWYRSSTHNTAILAELMDYFIRAGRLPAGREALALLEAETPLTGAQKTALRGMLAAAGR